MLAVYGLLVMAVSVLMFTYAVLAFRRPMPPKWTTLPTMEATVTIGFTGAVAFGFGVLIKHLLGGKAQTFGMIEGILVAAILVGFVVCWRFMKPGKRLAAYEAEERAAHLAARVDTAVTPAMPANDPGKVASIAAATGHHKGG